MTLLSRGSAVLAVIDVQERLLAAFPEPVRSAVVRNVSTLVESAGVLGVPTIVSEQYPRGLGPTVADVRDRLGAAFAPIEKIVFSCGINTNICHC